MKHRMGSAALLIALVNLGCHLLSSSPPWFDGTFEDAMVAARARGATLMLDFYSPT